MQIYTMIEARKAKGLNQTQLAAALKRTQTFVSNYERGERRVGMVDFVLIARVLGVGAGGVVAAAAVTPPT